jgi:hypothetical protein
MATIVRGHSFGVNDIVTAFTLNKLVSGALVSGLALEGTGGITAGTTPTDTMQVGALGAIYEVPLTQSTASWSEYNYLLKTNEGLVALFAPLRLETRRFFHDSSADVPGTALAFQTAGQGATLLCARSYTDQATPRHLFLGSPPLTCNTAASNHMDRIILKGAATVRIIEVPSGAGTQTRRYFQMDNRTATGQWEHASGATNTDKVAGMALDIQTGNDNRVTGFLFGGPLYRSP